MAACKFFTVATMLISFISSNTAWNFSITRISTHKLPNSVVDSIDKFNITGCSSVDHDCTKFGGQELQDKCQCICNQDKSTFGFYNDQWGCTDNSIVQKHADCRYGIQRPGSMGELDPLFTLPVLGSHNDNNYVGNVPNKTCKVIAANATFLKCDGTWSKLTESAVKRKLAFQDHKTGVVYMGPYQPSSPADPSIDGRVIRIPIECEGLTWDPSQCVTFKIKGRITCSSRPVPITTDQPTTSIPITAISTKLKTTKSDVDDPTPAAALIAGSVVGALIFITLIVVIITLVICLRRKKAKANEKGCEGREETERTEASEHQAREADLVIAPYAQFLGQGIRPIVTDDRNRESDQENEPDYQYPRPDNRGSEANVGTEPYYKYPRRFIGQGPNHVDRPVANDSDYETMNPLYQNFGHRKLIEPPYVNIC